MYQMYAQEQKKAFILPNYVHMHALYDFTDQKSEIIGKMQFFLKKSLFSVISLFIQNIDNVDNVKKNSKMHKQKNLISSEQ